MGRLAVAVATVVLVTASGSPAAPVAAVSADTAMAPVTTAGARSARPSDFNGDGYADPAIGVPHDRPGGHGFGPGAVNVLYGSSAGLTASGDQLWCQDSAGIKGVGDGGDDDDIDPRPGDGFGTAVASGDFDADGYADLAVGVPSDRVDGVAAGAVNVIYGSRSGLTADGDQLWSEASLPGEAALGERFGGSLAAADFNGDGYADLAIGMQDSDQPELPLTTAVDILFGGPTGLVAAGMIRLAPGVAGVPWLPEAASGLPALAAGDTDADGYADLAIGIGLATVDGHSAAGAVALVHGSASGIDPGRGRLWTQDSPGVPDAAEADDRFGGSVALGDFDGDGRADLAIGAHWEGIAATREGSVTVLEGSPVGLVATGAQLWHQGVPGVPGAPETPDGLGSALAAGDVNGDGRDDLAMGAPGEAVGSVAHAGSVTLLYGTSTGLSATGAKAWTQDSKGVPGRAQAYDSFGSSLAMANFGRSARADLAIGVPYEYVADRSDGIVEVLYGRLSGLSSIDSQAWSQNTAGIKGLSEHPDRFGWALSP